MAVDKLLENGFAMCVQLFMLKCNNTWSTASQTVLQIPLPVSLAYFHKL